MSDFRPSNLRRALLADAVAQVLDNRVFRILTVLSALVVALTFAVGFREDSVWLFGGLGEYFYEDLFSFFGSPLPVGGEAQQRLAISTVQTLFVDYLAGYIGILFCIGATVFFVPAMLEKGFADTLFSKPVSRWSLLLSRYLASILFIAFLTAFLVGGMHLGFTVGSGFSDPSFLWSGLTLVYVFALVSSYAVLFGVLTRSTVASLLLTLVAYGVTTGAHAAFMPIQLLRDSGAIERLHEEYDRGQVTEVQYGLARTGMALVETAHFILPKTFDAKFITADLRDRLITAEDEWELERAREQTEEDLEAGRKIAVREQDGILATERMNPLVYYKTRLGWDAELRYNYWFSIGSSLAFVGLALALAWLRLRRISF